MNGNDIKRARETAGLNQQEVADALGLQTRVTLSDIEAGNVDVTPAWTLRAIGVINGISSKRNQDS